jgi:hypothetical protein
MPVSGSDVERRDPIIVLQIDVTARSNELFRDGRMPVKGREMQRRAPIRVLVVDEGLRALRRQQPC